MDPLSIPAPAGVHIPARDELLTKGEARELVCVVLKVSRWTYHQCYFPELRDAFRPLDYVRTGAGTVREATFRIRAGVVLDLIADRVARLDDVPAETA